MKTRITIINHPSQLNALSSYSFSRRRGLGKIELSDVFQHPEREKLEENLNKNYYACGCSTSARYLISGLVVGVLAVAVDNTFFETHRILHPISTVLITTFGGAIIGKLVGLSKANSKLKRTIHTIQAFWRPKTESPMTEQPICG
jgi:hypothetical protein